MKLECPVTSSMICTSSRILSRGTCLGSISFTARIIPVVVSRPLYTRPKPPDPSKSCVCTSKWPMMSAIATKESLGAGSDNGEGPQSAENGDTDDAPAIHPP